MTKERVTRICGIENCDRPHEAKGLCRKHYQRFKEYGDPLRQPFPPKSCNVDGCGQKHYAKGYCPKHYERFHTYGDPLQLSPPYGRGDTPKERFWSKVDKSLGLGRDGDCWEWRGGQDAKGYGEFTIQWVKWRTHRLSYFWEHGVMPTLDVLHSCDNPCCVNPKHLSEGTTRDNATDRQLRGRSARGETHGMAKITAQDVLAIRELFDSNRLSCAQLVQQFNISDSQIRRITTREAWKCLE